MFIKFNGICDLNPVEVRHYLTKHRPIRVGSTILISLTTQVARQITLVEASLFKAIKPHELLNQAWTKKDKETKAPNALKMIRHSSRVRASYHFRIRHTLITSIILDLLFGSSRNPSVRVYRSASWSDQAIYWHSSCKYYTLAEKHIGSNQLSRNVARSVISTPSWN